MADFVVPQSGMNAPPDVLAAYLRGQMAPGNLMQQQQQIAGGNQSLQAGALNLQQLQQAMKFNQFKNNVLMNAIPQGLGGSAPNGGTQDASSQSAPTGGIQNGPQGSVSAPSVPGQSPLQANGDQSPWTAGGPNIPTISPGSRMAIGLLAPEMAKGMDEAQAASLKNAQIQSSQPGTPLSVLRALASDPNSDQMLMNNPQLLAHWPAVARQFGADPTQINPINVRRVATLAANQQLNALQLPPLPMPEHYGPVTAGSYGQQTQTEDSSGKVSEVAPRVVPTFSMEKSYDPTTGHNVGNLVRTGGLDVNGNPIGATTGPGAPRGQQPGPSGAQPASNGIDLGLTAPTGDNIKQAAFAASMKDGLDVMRNLENKGVALSPTQRASLIDVATNEDPGAVHAWLSQESLKHALTPQQQSYIAGMFPVIQAVSHDQAGARVTTSQLRMNLESIIPIDAANKDAMQTINNTRNNFQKAMNVGAGSAAVTPEFNQSVGAARRTTASNNVAPSAAINYLKAHPEAAAAFKQKYGYSP